MSEKRQYYGLDLVKFGMALLVAARHTAQIYFDGGSRLRFLLANWLSNLAVPVFFVISGFLLFRKVTGMPETERQAGGRQPSQVPAAAAGLKGMSAGTRAALTSCLRMIKLYVLWSVLYLPIDFHNWRMGTDSLSVTVRHYVKCFLFSSTTAQLWYLPALAEACFLVWLLYRLGLKTWQILLVTVFLFAVGCMGDNWYFRERSPWFFQQFCEWYTPKFMTMRNGVFYGSFYVAAGLWFAGRERRGFPGGESGRRLFAAASAGTVLFVLLMYAEVRHCSNTNMVISAAPAAVCLMAAAVCLRLPKAGLWAWLRQMSEWIYLTHVYSFYIFSWFVITFGLLLNKWQILAGIMLPLSAFAGLLTLLSRTKQFAWLRKLI